MSLDLYLDTADTAAWDALMPTGLFTGITTNPLLAQKAGLSYGAIDWAEMARRAADHGARELHVQVAGAPEGYADFAARLRRIGADAGLTIVMKVPLTEDGIRAAPALLEGGPVLMTACYDARQMFVAARLGAQYIAPYYGRMLEAGLDADDALARMRAIGQAAGGGTRILIASIRDTVQMTRLAAAGQDCFAIAPHVAQALLADERTLAAAAEFERAAAS